MEEKNKIKSILREGVVGKITKISVFDFDGTLVDTPLPDTGKGEYEAKTGVKWPYEGWWGRKESLDGNVFEMPVIPDVIRDYNIAKSNPSTLKVMMTGRMAKLSNEVEIILRAKNLSFDEYIYNRGGSTLDYKLKSLDRLIVKYPDVTEVELWDDRLEHIPAFEQWGKDHPELKFNINVVPSGHH